jgi:hypothetical protein
MGRQDGTRPVGLRRVSVAFAVFSGGEARELSVSTHVR